MGYSNNREPRRFWHQRSHARDPERCASCGARSPLPYCHACLDGKRVIPGGDASWDDAYD